MKTVHLIIVVHIVRSDGILTYLLLVMPEGIYTICFQNLGTQNAKWDQRAYGIVPIAV